MVGELIRQDVKDWRSEQQALLFHRMQDSNSPEEQELIQRVFSFV